MFQSNYSLYMLLTFKKKSHGRKVEYSQSKSLHVNLSFFVDNAYYSHVCIAKYRRINTFKLS